MDFTARFYGFYMDFTARYMDFTAIKTWILLLFKRMDFTAIMLRQKVVVFTGVRYALVVVPPHTNWMTGSVGVLCKICFTGSIRSPCVPSLTVFFRGVACLRRTFARCLVQSRFEFIPTTS